MNSGEIIYAFLGAVVPIVLLGTLIWRLADRTRGLQASVETAAEKAATSSAGVARIEANVAAMREELHRDYVRQDALRETEARIGRRIDGVDTSVGRRLDVVENTVRDTATTIIAALSAVDAPPLPRRRRPQS